MLYVHIGGLLCATTSLSVSVCCVVLWTDLRADPGTIRLHPPDLGEVRSWHGKGSPDSPIRQFRTRNALQKSITSAASTALSFGRESGIVPSSAGSRVCIIITAAISLRVCGGVVVRASRSNRARD